MIQCRNRWLCIAMTNLGFYAYLVRLTANAAHALGNSADEATWNTLFDCVKGGFNAKYWRPALGTYSENANGPFQQASNVMALDWGLVPDANKAALQAAVANRVMTTDTGH
jgi:hypothetical protein